MRLKRPEGSSNGLLRSIATSMRTARGSITLQTISMMHLRLCRLRSDIQRSYGLTPSRPCLAMSTALALLQPRPTAYQLRHTRSNNGPMPPSDTALIARELTSTTILAVHVSEGRCLLRTGRGARLNGRGRLAELGQDCLPDGWQGGLRRWARASFSRSAAIRRRWPIMTGTAPLQQMAQATPPDRPAKHPPHPLCS